jgi:hypothetical protein
MRPKTAHSMMLACPSTSVRAGQQVPTAPSCRQAERRSQKRSPGSSHVRTSRPELPTSDLRQNRSACSEKRRRRPSRSPHERRPAPRTMDATDTKVLGIQSRGRSQMLLYNTLRPHGSMDYKPPAPEVFVPALAARAAPQSQPAPPPALASRPSMH